MMVVIMKNYIVFIVSFLLLYTGAQVLSGFILTALYTPHIAHMQNPVQESVTFGNYSFLPYSTVIIAASLAYYLSQKLFTQSNS